MNSRLYVGNLAFNTSEDTIPEAFAQFGEVTEVRLTRWQRARNPSRQQTSITDGHPDLVVATPSRGNLHVLFNRGDASFGGLETYPAGSSPVDVTAVDVNDDGRPDLSIG